MLASSHASSAFTLSYVVGMSAVTFLARSRAAPGHIGKLLERDELLGQMDGQRVVGAQQVGRCRRTAADDGVATP